jgi:hypothetical protein
MTADDYRVAIAKLGMSHRIGESFGSASGSRRMMGMPIHIGERRGPVGGRVDARRICAARASLKMTDSEESGENS